ncbi:uncharacterized protein N7469_000764 [Penicillium citrinum]|uniref:Uncharacterized protein n=1 Tax=Penicillium citrinum TaxID=5077 RepID=A0A9W9TUZ6_PENCI|nr:uncharacterized protein N7469_000764 [Penicillium citrinum]KAJ5242437.1 hypothetical protein N7469_000764 [Penicillium citrinum]
MWIYRYRHRSNPYELEKSTTVPSVALPTFPGSFVPKEKSHQLVESTGLELIDPEESYKILRKICLAQLGNHSVTEHYYGDLPSLEMSTLDALITLLFLKGNVLQKSPPRRKFPIERYLQSIRPEEVEVKTDGWTYLACPDASSMRVYPNEFKGVIEWLPKRKGNGWKDSKGKPVANRKIWEQIGDTLIKIESNVNVQFWLVEEAMNAPMQDCLPTHVSAKKTVQRVRVLSDRQ